MVFADERFPCFFLAVADPIDRAGPFDGLLGFSQGANLASLLTGLLSAHC